MRPDFPIFQNHKDFVHGLWKSLIKPGAVVCDATCGNGHDSAILASLCLDEDQGRLFCIDIQQDAIHNTSKRLESLFSKNVLSKVAFFLQSHEHFPPEIQGCDLIVYNLGYLPSGCKALTTTTASTIKSLTQALNLLHLGGVITVMCYPGHPEGFQEEKDLLAFTSTLDPKTYLVYHQKILNRQQAPSLLVISKRVK